MKDDLKALFVARVGVFRLPRYRELPNMGLYLEQVTKYINGFLNTLGCPEITPSMVSNYVKKGVISAPVKKQYNAEQIAYLLFVSFAKSVLSLEDIMQLVTMQKAIYDVETAYDYFCSELENMLLYIAGLQDTVKNIGVSNTVEKTMFRSVIIAASHIVFLNNCFETVKTLDKEEAK